MFPILRKLRIICFLFDCWKIMISDQWIQMNYVLGNPHVQLFEILAKFKFPKCVSRTTDILSNSPNNHIAETIIRLSRQRFLGIHSLVQNQKHSIILRDRGTEARFEQSVHTHRFSYVTPQPMLSRQLSRLEPAHILTNTTLLIAHSFIITINLFLSITNNKYPNNTLSIMNKMYEKDVILRRKISLPGFLGTCAWRRRTSCGLEWARRSEWSSSGRCGQGQPCSESRWPPTANWDWIPFVR